MRIIGALPLAALLAGASVSPALAQTTKATGPTVTLSGFVNSTVFVQNQAFEFGNGQNAEWAANREVIEDRWFLGADVRNTRLALTVAGGDTSSAWTPKGSVEIDFFGGFNGTTAFSDEQPLLRLRAAYVEISNGRTTLRVGQSFTPLFGFVPVSVSHLGFPLGFGSAGVIGWRNPGIYVTHTLTGTASAVKLGVQAAAFRGSWSGPGSTLDQQSAGEASAIPQLEARLDLSGKFGTGSEWSAYAVGHYDEKDLSGVGPDMTNAGTLTGWATSAGARVTSGRLTLQGSAYRGRAIGHQFAQIIQFGDIDGWGGWAQAGVSLTKSLSVWGFGGLDDPDDEDIAAAIVGPARLRNRIFAGLLRYTLGPYTLGAEWMQATTRWVDPTGPEPTESIDRTADQFALSAMFTF